MNSAQKWACLLSTILCASFSASQASAQEVRLDGCETIVARASLKVIGNTFGVDCGSMPDPVANGTVSCTSLGGAAGNGIDIYWAADNAGSFAANINSDITKIQSSASLNIPDGSVIKKAKLFWAGISKATAKASVAATLELPDRSFSSFTADSLLTLSNGSVARNYIASKDVTDLMPSMNANGLYTIRGITSTAIDAALRGANNGNLWAGWALFIVYEPRDKEQKPIEKLHTISICDRSGLITLARNMPNPINVYLQPPYVLKSIANTMTAGSLGALVFGKGPALSTNSMTFGSLGMGKIPISLMQNKVSVQFPKTSGNPTTVINGFSATDKPSLTDTSADPNKSALGLVDIIDASIPAELISAIVDPDPAKPPVTILEGGDTLTVGAVALALPSNLPLLDDSVATSCVGRDNSAMYGLTIKNSGQTPMSGSSVKIELPAEITTEPASVRTANGTVMVSTNKRTVTIPDLGTILPNNSKVVLITLKLSLAAGTKAEIIATLEYAADPDLPSELKSYSISTSLINTPSSTEQCSMVPLPPGDAGGGCLCSIQRQAPSMPLLVQIAAMALGLAMLFRLCLRRLRHKNQ